MTRRAQALVALLAAILAVPSAARAMTFRDAPGSPITESGEAGGVAIGDFNGDGHSDIAVPLTYGSGYLAVWLGDGDGHFTRATGTQPQLCFADGVTAADFNGDGKDDLALACWEGSTELLYGNGDGTFTAGPSVTGASDSVASGDFNGDGSPDLVATNDWRSIYATVFFGNGSGSFSSGPSLPIASPGAVAAGDVNHDGISDIAIADIASNTVSIFLGNRDGSLAPVSGSPIVLTQRPRSLAIADLNGDGIADLAVGTEDGTVTVLPGDGSGHFGPRPVAQLSVGYEPSGLAAGDFDGDGHLDLTSASDNIDPGRLSVLLNATPPLSITTGPSGSVRETHATFEFGSVDPAVAFDCRLDDSAWTACTAPLTYAGLAAGPHTLQVQATNDAGLSARVSRDWDVDLSTPPLAALTASPTVVLTGQAVALDASASHDALDGTISDYRWDLDGSGGFDVDTGTDPTTTTTYDTPGIMHPQVLAANELGTGAGAAATVDVRPAPPAGEVGVSINDGDYATDSPKVQLHVVWPAYASHALISNDGGFGAQGDTSNVPLASTIAWTLRSQTGERLTKVVYLRFPDTALPAETFSDDIVVDTTAPAVQSASFVRAGARATAATARPRLRTFRIRIHATEKRSGISAAQFSTNGTGNATVVLADRRHPGIRAISRVLTVRMAARPKYVRVRSAAGKWSKPHRIS